MFHIQSMIVMTFTKETEMKPMTCSLYPGGLFHVTNIRIAKIIVFYTLYHHLTLKVRNIDYPTAYSAHQEKLTKFLCEELVVLRI